MHSFIKYFLVLLLVVTCSASFVIAQSPVRWHVNTQTTVNTPTTVNVSTSGTTPATTNNRVPSTGRIAYNNNIYDAPHGKVIGGVQKSQVVNIYKLSPDNNWYCIAFGSSKGYIPSHIVILDSSVTTTSPGQNSNNQAGWNVAVDPTPPPQTNSFPTPIDNSQPQTNSIPAPIDTPVNTTPAPVNAPQPVVTNDPPIWNVEVPTAPLPPPVAQPNATLMDVPGYTTADLLNVRTGPWGDKIGQLPYQTKIKIIGQDGDWYKIEYNGMIGYIHSNHTKTGNIPKPPYNGVSGNAQLGKNLVASAKSYIGSKGFRGAEVAYGRLACAQFVSTVLNDNNVIPVVLNVRSLVSKLKMKGWVEVTPPPYKDGDVVTWKTYDYTGDGVKDPDSHVGIVDVKSNGVYAIHNSSTRKYPRETNVDFGAPISRVLRSP